MLKYMKILAIETSCDETAVAVLATRGQKLNLLSNVISSQIPIHRRYGGVVPEVAARCHIEQIIPVIDQSLRQAKSGWKNINAIAVTAGPGLITSLLVGVEMARALAWSLDKPLIAVNHMYGHIAGAMINQKITFPALALIVSGGHTELIVMQDYHRYRKIGQTVDDAVGEAYDKVAKLLHLPYPGGPEIAQRAAKGDADAYPFPRPMMANRDYNFSYSGLKTAVLYQSAKCDLKNKKVVADLCASFQRAAIDVLVAKVDRAIREHKIKTLIVAGGVAANTQLRADMTALATDLKVPLLLPDQTLCTDNAGMIAIAAYYLLTRVKPNKKTWQKINADPNWELV